MTHDDVVNGLVCEVCERARFVAPHGHPVVCRSCWSALPDAAKAERLIALHVERAVPAR